MRIMRYVNGVNISRGELEDFSITNDIVLRTISKVQDKLVYYPEKVSKENIS